MATFRSMQHNAVHPRELAMQTSVEAHIIPSQPLPLPSSTALHLILVDHQTRGQYDWPFPAHTPSSCSSSGLNHPQS